MARSQTQGEGDKTVPFSTIKTLLCWVSTYCIVSMINKNICFHSGRNESKPLPFPEPDLLPGQGAPGQHSGRLSTPSAHLRPSALTVPKPTDPEARSLPPRPLLHTVCMETSAHRDPNQRAGSLRPQHQRASLPLRGKGHSLLSGIKRWCSFSSATK